ncbi:MAG: hypothetical protein AAF216_09300 [Pseudomonadota bacterium]
MQRPVSFRGQSGRVYPFETVENGSDWIRRAGVALFAAPSGACWRVIRICEVRGREDDIQPLWAQADAASYGGDTVLTCETASPEERRAIAEDLEAGLSPLWASTDLPLAA